jgi:hypothetical protein
MASSITIVSTFTSGLEGWTTTDAGAVFTQVATGGNPGGYLSHDNSEQAIAQLLAPAAFLGDLSAFIGGTFSFDGNLLGAGGSFFDGPNGIPGGVFLDYGIIQLIGPTLTAQVDLLPGGATAPSGAWQTYSIGLNAAAWGMTSANFNTLMQNVTSIRITIEGLWGAEFQGIDNISLVSADVSPSSSAVPEPASLLLVGVGLAFVGVRARRAQGQARSATIQARLPAADGCDSALLAEREGLSTPD